MNIYELSVVGNGPTTPSMGPAGDNAGGDAPAAAATAAAAAAPAADLLTHFSMCPFSTSLRLNFLPQSEHG